MTIAIGMQACIDCSPMHDAEIVIQCPGASSQSSVCRCECHTHDAEQPAAVATAQVRPSTRTVAEMPFAEYGNILYSAISSGANIERFAHVAQNPSLPLVLRI